MFPPAFTHPLILLPQRAFSSHVHSYENEHLILPRRSRSLQAGEVAFCTPLARETQTSSGGVLPALSPPHLSRPLSSAHGQLGCTAVAVLTSFASPAASAGRVALNVGDDLENGVSSASSEDTWLDAQALSVDYIATA